MIGVSEGKDQEARAILELVGIDSDKYRIWHHNSIYVHAINEETKESVIVEKATLEVVKSPGAGRQSGTQKIKTITQLNYRAKMGDKSSEI